MTSQPNEALTYLELETLIRKAKPIIKDLLQCVSQAHFAEDPITLFKERIKNKSQTVADLRSLLQVILPRLNYTWFFTQVGLNHSMGLFSEIFTRIEERLLPPLLHPTEVMWLIQRLFSREEIEILLKLNSAQLYKLVHLFGQEDSAMAVITPQIQSSIEILSQRIVGLGLDALLARKFLRHPEYADSFITLGRLGRDQAYSEQELIQKILKCIADCENALDYIKSQRESEGTSLILSYRIFLIEDLLERLRSIVLTFKTDTPASFMKHVVPVMLDIIHTHNQRIRISDFFARNVEILAYQVTLLTGRTGENYISNNLQELKNMWIKAIKGAFVVAIMVLVKLLASKLSLAPLPQAFVFGTIYGLGFILLKEFGGVLATKQPAMTASTIAAAMDGVKNSQKALENLSDAIIRTLRTQMAALLGNFLFAFPFSALLVFPFLILNLPFVDYAEARHIVMDLHPLWSLSFLYAIIAGVCLFLSGLISGLADNWFDYNQIALRLNLIFTSFRSHRYINVLKKNFGAWTGNIILGFMLGSMHSLGLIIGIPLDIRHVTFSSGYFGVAWIHQESMMPWSEFTLIALSILMIGFINLAVSFSLSLLVAMRSRRLHFVSGRKLLWMVLRRILKSPTELFIHRDSAASSK